MTAAAIAAILILKEEELVAHMRLARALSPDTAKSPDDMGVDARRALARLMRHGVIHEASAGRFYLDEAAWDRFRSKRRNRVGILVGAVILTVIAFYLLSARGALSSPV